ncbi:MAG: UPF0182 family protein [Deltaproteobacteria bacterium]|nr:UPF0182 family protein [Deltaproteobacteria bacterium]
MMKKKVLLGAGLLLFFILWVVASFYPDWLWFNNLRYTSVFWPSALGKTGFGAAIWIAFLGIIFINLKIAKAISSKNEYKEPVKNTVEGFSQHPLSGKTLDTLILVLVLVASLIIATKGAKQWPMVLSYFYQQPFDIKDPVFGRDIGFYVFSLPFYLTLQYGLLLIVGFSGLLSAMWYLKDGVLQIVEEPVEHTGKSVGIPRIRIAPSAAKHLLFICGILLLLIAWGYQLKVPGLLYSTKGPAFGASYTDVHVRMPAYRVIIILTLATGILFLSSAYRSSRKFLWKAGIGWLAAVFVLGTVIPGMVQKFVVKPNELVKERTYIGYNIAFTRKGYDLEKIREVRFPVDNRLEREDLRRYRGTVENIRIWDERPLLQTYRQIQSIRLYYDFNNVDVDRYTVGGHYRQVMLAARELLVDKLPPQANTWVNRHLIYTHGYGVATSPVNEVTREGLPRLLIKDLPPEGVPELEITRPEIYFGERTDEYVLVNTKAKEFDYPKGDRNVYATYVGKGGVPLTGVLRRLVYAIEFKDPQIFFTNYLTPESRILYNRKIERRVRAIAPFLEYDRDPYLVIAGGRLFWILDAYTTSDMYPYSHRSYSHFGNKGVNYIRNSVKVVIDAYNGRVQFFKMDEKDPILNTYERIFPGLFKPLSEMPDEIKGHLRYPRDLFELQAETYGIYHMQDIQVFYNQEDLWQVPDEIYGGIRRKMKPYYIIISLPGEKREEFLLMLPFTPSKKDNMIGWLAARSDMPNYGNLVVYKLPKEKLVYGPMQIEARIDQQTDISRELSLWDQRGSRVIRGNMLAIPIRNTFLYIEPVYLEAKQEREETAPASNQRTRLKKGQARRSKDGITRSPTEGKGAAALPELKRVIAALGNRVVMEEDLEKALAKLIRVTSGAEDRGTLHPSTTTRGDVGGLAESALEHYRRAKKNLQNGDWAGFGRELEYLEKILKDMSGQKSREN